MKRKSNKFLVVFSLICVICTLTTNTFALTVAEAEKELSNIQKKINSNQSQINAVRDEVQNYLNQISSLNAEISEYEKQLGELKEQEDAINKQIEKYQNDLQNSAQLYNSAEDIYTTRLRTIYENGIPSVFEILVSSNGIDDFFSKLGVYTSILEYDQSLIGNMKSQKEYVDYLKSNIEEGKTSLQALSYDIEKSTKELESVKAAQQAKVKALNSSESKLLAAQDILNNQKNEAEANKQKAIEEARKIAAANRPSGTYTSTSFIWPTVSSYITSGFGYYNVWGFIQKHNGIDIGVGVGTEVYAAAAGTVIIATKVTSNPYGYGGSSKTSWSAANGYGYGNYIAIEHYDGKITLYGHLYTLNVRAGQTVYQGQVIGHSGSTGNSSGPHLHFEVRVNNVAVNPMSYFN